MLAESARPWNDGGLIITPPAPEIMAELQREVEEILGVSVRSRKKQTKKQKLARPTTTKCARSKTAENSQNK
ncbi:MAG: hypothetical protein CXZ00_15290 [Acidobacteria bacterium]|nr:MAG: hypothetical protein CXZ00_15290 [Acidobacteriota bacterium]